MSSKYYTIADATCGEFKEKGSKFLAFAYSAASEDEIKEALDGLRKQYHDARHHCYAYVIGLNEQAYRANDDGEPNHSAGDPILGQIRSNELTNCLVVVIRYFGGTKLGVPGLINAYRTATSEALNQATRKELIQTQPGSLHFGYDQLGIVERWTDEFQMEVTSRDFKVECIMYVNIPSEHISELMNRLSESPLVTFHLVP